MAGPDQILRDQVQGRSVDDRVVARSSTVDLIGPVLKPPGHRRKGREPTRLHGLAFAHFAVDRGPLHVQVVRKLDVSVFVREYPMNELETIARGLFSRLDDLVAQVVRSEILYRRPRGKLEAPEERIDLTVCILVDVALACVEHLIDDVVSIDVILDPLVSGSHCPAIPNERAYRAVEVRPKKRLSENVLQRVQPETNRRNIIQAGRVVDLESKPFGRRVERIAVHAVLEQVECCNRLAVVDIGA